MIQACPRCGLLHPAGAPCFALSLPQTPGTEQLQPGFILAGRYQILRTIHRGGMSVVYLAEDTVQGRQVALKELRLPDEASHHERQEAESWFARESFLLSALRHPLIPTFYSVFREGDHSYIAQEYVEGENLDTLVRQQGPAAEEAVVAWGMALCDLLSFLHRLPEPIIFRDLKPSNIVLRASTRKLAVVDFGIARHFQRGEVGTVVGTPGYAPPEQYQGLATPQSDVYALGITLYRLLTGYDPEHGTPFTLPPLQQIAPHTSPGLAAIVEQAVRLNPAERFPSAASMGAALRAQAAREYGLRQAPAAPDPWPASGQPAGSARPRAGAGRGWAILVAMLLIPSLMVRGFGTMQPASVPITEAPSGDSPGIGPDADQHWASYTIGRSVPVAPDELRCTWRTVPRIYSDVIAPGSDGSFWTVYDGSALAHLTADGHAVACIPPVKDLGITGAVAAPDGTVWFTEYQGNAIGRLSLNGQITQYPLPAPMSNPYGITLGQDGNIWFTERSRDAIGRLAADGYLTEYDLHCACNPLAITSGADGDLWFTNEHTAAVLRLTLLGGLFDDYAIPAAGTPNAIATAPDGSIWFTERDRHLIGRIAPGGGVSQIQLPADSYPSALTVGPDGTIWFADQFPHALPGHIGRITPDETVVERFPAPRGTELLGLATGSEGTIWWVGKDFGRITAGGQVIAVPTGTAQRR